jgi:uncharacterized protein
VVATAVELESAIRNFVALLESGIRVERVILYGSYARNTAYDGSDIDVAVISPDFEEMPINRRQEIIADLTHSRDRRISPLGYSSSQYKQPGPHSFIGEIIRTGRVVYEARE